MTYVESAALMKDQTFMGRVKVAALNYAQSLSLQPSLSNSQSKWINQAMTQSDFMAQMLTPPVVMNPNVQQGGAAVSDADLQAAVQAVANQTM